MSNLISGKEALMALANGETVEYLDVKEWFSVNEFIENWAVIEFLSGEHKFRLKPKTISINGVEVPAPFKPEDGDTVWCVSDDHVRGYCNYDWDKHAQVIVGAWRTEDEIKQVVAALKQVFNHE